MSSPRRECLKLPKKHEFTQPTRPAEDSEIPLHASGGFGQPAQQIRHSLLCRMKWDETKIRADDWHGGRHIPRVDHTPIIRVGTRHNHDATIVGSLVNTRGNHGRSSWGPETSGQWQGLNLELRFAGWRQSQEWGFVAQRWHGHDLARGVPRPGHCQASRRTLVENHLSGRQSTQAAQCHRSRAN